MPRSSDSRRPIVRAIISTLAIVGYAGVASGQTVDASILGTVRDSTGAGIATAVVTTRNTATGVVWTAATTSTGRFAFLELPLGGPYTITVRRLGYRPEMRAGYQLTLGSRVFVDVVVHRAATELAPIVVTGTAEERRAPNMGANFRVGGDSLAQRRGFQSGNETILVYGQRELRRAPEGRKPVPGSTGGAIRVLTQH